MNLANPHIKARRGFEGNFTTNTPGRDFDLFFSRFDEFIFFLFFKQKLKFPPHARSTDHSGLTMISA